MLSYLLRSSIPVAGNWHIAGIAQPKDDLCKTICIAIAQEEGAVTIDPNRVGAIVVQIACHGLVAGQAIIQGDIRKARFIRILQEEHTIARTEDSGRVQAIPVPIPGNPYIPGISQEE